MDKKSNHATPASAAERASKEVHSTFEKRISTFGESELWEIHVPISTSNVMDYLCKELYSVASMTALKEINFKEEDLLEVGKYLLAARTGYIFGIRGETPPRDIEYPAMLGPVLAAIGRYTDGERNVVITPCPADYVEKADDSDHFRAKQGVKIRKPEKYDQVIASLRVLGVPTVFGLPMDKKVETDDFFRIEMTEDLLSGASTRTPNPAALLARTLVEMTYVESLFGRVRVAYTSVATMKVGIRELVALNVDGPSMKIG